MDLLKEMFTDGSSRQIAVRIEDLERSWGLSHAQTCQLLIDMQGRGDVQLSIWHPAASPDTDLPGYPHCVPYDQWKEWEPWEFFTFGVHDQGRIRINVL